MSFGMKQRFSFILVFLAGCTSFASSTKENVTSTQSALPSTTINVVPAQTIALATPTRLIISEPTIQTTPIILQPTWTSQPTLTGSDALEAINAMVVTNGGCQLPCWWGITPGETSWENALIMLSMFAPKIKSSEPNSFSWDGSTYHNSVVHYVSYEHSNSRIRREAVIVVLDDIVSRIILRNEIVGEIFDIPNLLAVYGEPINIFIDTFNNTPSGILPFQMVLFYPNHRFVAVFNFTGNKNGEYIEVCYKPSTPTVYSWSSEEDLLVKVAGFSALVQGDWAFSKDLETSTNLDLETFYQYFINPTSASCLETPSGLW